MSHDNWKQETPPSDIDFEPLTEEEEQESYLLELINERNHNKEIIKKLLDITKDEQPYIYSQLKKLK
jgi:hypothetical protein